MWHKKYLASFSILCVVMVIAYSCKKLMPAAAPEEHILDGFVEGLNAQQSAQFLKGDFAFNDELFNSTNRTGSRLLLWNWLYQLYDFFCTHSGHCRCLVGDYRFLGFRQSIHLLAYF